ncbi:MAG: divalent-cation tolerance protein CutA [Desulfobacterales bacterium]|nr:divalent-cation tolerance protein CutA [Deltaproteobacteria bacterium]NNK93448.1 divalent-cation tolerance protein CutA [Desulfobacterales bacterium]
MQPIIVTTTCETGEDAQRLAQLLLKKRLAACVQVSSPVQSFYWWQSEIAADGEFLITMKSERRLFDRVASTIKDHHPYDVPEIVATEIVAIDNDYLTWLTEELR